ILLMWGVLGLSMLGLGLWLHRFWRDRDLDGEMLFSCFWSGFALTIAVLLWWSLFARLGGGAPLTVIALLGLSRVIAQRRRLLAMVRATRLGWGRIALFAVLLVYLADRSLGPCQCFDTGLYHLQVVNWSAAYPAITGLANLHHRLGFNNASLLLAA